MPPTHPLDGVDLRARVQRALDEHLARQREVLAELGDEVAPLVDVIAELLAGGKRLRATFLYWGWRACGGPDDDAAVRAGSAMEIFQASALLHDDVMDNSDLRRGRPTAHRTFAALHADRGWNGDPERFGHAAAILAGDLCLNWTDEVLTTSGLPPEALARARPEFDRMRTQLMGGQYLDILEGARGWADLGYAERLDRCRTVIRYKSAQYSVSHPLLIGARAAGADPGTLAALTTYGLHLGEAFQLRDDVLGVFGDPEQTGKPAGDDLREGKHTALVAHALELADEEGAELISAALGDPDLDDETVRACREVLVRSGALGATEAMIEAGAASARRALAAAPTLTDAGREALDALVAICTDRQT
ncbi:polyprenyl synthetase family protein [Ornithinimicrobium tianjinense]|uniref:Geranylgeranyl pyrophosphate synthase n=1 Tax=Ornithinimicrobium tianjinense TaxID=1195761 RepID=A0A917F223_9MICO|nr:polyprenyl synthetase family protein [Ornithinimicrobium tianjinense]GGF45289.1 geranylgeranyl pyrophosphate synthase [Ornithinimicrobium tianjinense]